MYKRILLKISGEALAGDQKHGINPEMVNHIVDQIVELHKKAKEKGITNSIATCTLVTEVGDKIYFSAGSGKNVKITTQEDIDIFKALLKQGE